MVGERERVKVERRQLKTFDRVGDLLLFFPFPPTTVHLQHFLPIRHFTLIILIILIILPLLLLK